MRPRRRTRIRLMFTAATAGLGLALPACSQTQKQPGESEARAGRKEHAPMTRAAGSFDVTLAPQTPYNQDPAAALGRFSLDKQFHGDLEATSKGEMLTAGSPATGSAGYVAVERVTGTLKGRSGSFALQHTGLMTRGTPELTIIVVPDSGTGQLAGISGRMTINIVDKKHFYEFEYAISEGK